MQCNAHEIILFLFGTINFTTKDQSQLIWTSFFCVVDWLGPVFKGPIAVPKYLKWSRPVAVASCLVLRKKTGLENTNTNSHHCPHFTPPVAMPSHSIAPMCTANPNNNDNTHPATVAHTLHHPLPCHPAQSLPMSTACPTMTMLTQLLSPTPYTIHCHVIPLDCPQWVLHAQTTMWQCHATHPMDEQWQHVIPFVPGQVNSTDHSPLASLNFNLGATSPSAMW